jgi:hypothetical protein
VLEPKNIAGHEDNQRIGNSRGGRITKIPTFVDGVGHPVGFMLIVFQVDDAVPTIDLLG